MAVVAKISALKFKLDAHALPSFGSYLPHGLAVGKLRLNRLDHVAEFLGEHAKKKYDALLVDRFMPQPAEVRRSAIATPVLQRRVSHFPRQSCGSRAPLRPPVLLLWRANSQKRQDVLTFRLPFGEFPKCLWQR